MREGIMDGLDREALLDLCVRAHQDMPTGDEYQREFQQAVQPKQAPCHGRRERREEESRAGGQWARSKRCWSCTSTPLRFRSLLRACNAGVHNNEESKRVRS